MQCNHGNIKVSDVVSSCTIIDDITNMPHWSMVTKLYHNKLLIKIKIIPNSFPIYFLHFLVIFQILATCVLLFGSHVICLFIINICLDLCVIRMDFLEKGKKSWGSKLYYVEQSNVWGVIPSEAFHFGACLKFGIIHNWAFRPWGKLETVPTQLSDHFRWNDSEDKCAFSFYWSWVYVRS